MNAPLKLKGTSKPWSKHILIIGDGFMANEMDSQAGHFKYYADRVANRIVAQPWYRSSVCVWMAETPVTNSNGLLQYSTAACGNIGVALPRTRFLSKYYQGAFCRMLKGDVGRVNNLVFDLIEEGLPDIKGTVVLVNYPAFGGSGNGQVAWASVAPGVFTSLAVHELGHTFGLLDEYENKCGSPDGPGSTMAAMNISSSAVAPYPLWYPRRNPGAWGIATKPNSTACDVTPPNPPILVGAYQGGYYTHTRYYRPSENCAMRDPAAAFCDVCNYVISTQV